MSKIKYEFIYIALNYLKCTHTILTSVLSIYVRVCMRSVFIINLGSSFFIVDIFSLCRVVSDFL